jgi:ATP-binding cassette subfamily F protein 3
MLDEPTNHLDLPSIQWIEGYIRTYEGAVIVVSHDRYFLDNVVDTIVEVSGQRLHTYGGNYSFYIEEKSLRNEIQKGAYENQQAMIRQTERFIERFRAKATKARQVQSRVKQLSRMELVDEVIDESARVNFKFNFSTQPGRFIMHLEDISKAYGEKVILNKTTAVIERGDKIALIGANGRGKSTLLRIIDGSENIQGERRLGYNVIDSFYAQHQLESLAVDNTLLDELKQTGTDKSESVLRSILGCFLFSGEDAFKRIKVLSGGEKSRVALAKVLISEANFLLLDEPTNHLDMQSVNILIQALQQYEGSYVVVSHDRYFVSEIANKIWYIENHEIKEYPGTYDEYEYWRSQTAAEQKESSNISPKVAKTSSSAPRPAAAPAPSSAAKVADLEQKVIELESLKQDLEIKMSAPDTLSQTELFKKLTLQHQQISQQLDEAMSAWEQAIG